MYCVKCGSEIFGSVDKCKNCGEKVNVSNTKQDLSNIAPTSALAIAALVGGSLAIVSMGFLSPVGIVLGAIAILQILLSRGKLKGLKWALIGIVLSILPIAQLLLSRLCF